MEKENTNLKGNSKGKMSIRKAESKDLFQSVHHVTFISCYKMIMNDSVMEIYKYGAPYRDREEIIIRDIQNRERISSQIFAEFGFALLHSRSQGVTRPTRAIIIFRYSVTGRDRANTRNISCSSKESF